MIKGNVKLDLSGVDESLEEIMTFVAANLEEVASEVESAAKTTAAFADKSGKLRGSIKKSKSKYEDGGFIVAAKAPHAHLVEFGHVMIAWGRITGRRVPAHPFMRPAKERGIRVALAKFGGKK